MALSEYAACLAWAAAALVVYAGADVANRRGWVRVDYRPKAAAMMLLTSLAIQRAAGPEVFSPACGRTCPPSFLYFLRFELPG